MKKKDVLRVLKETSRTFYLPIVRLPSRLQEAISSAYLCMRALDEIEDHTGLDNGNKSGVLREISSVIQSNIAIDDIAVELHSRVFSRYLNVLPEVSLRIGEWLSFAPAGIGPRIWEATASMAERMAYWAERNWEISTEADLNEYTFSVAGAVGLLICDIWAWFDGTQLDRISAIHFGRSLQSVNILRNREEDLGRKVDFYPKGWANKEILAYARQNVARTRREMKPIPQLAFAYLVEIPLSLAEATLDTIESGRTKLSRQQVLQIMAQIKSVNPAETS
jgi:farnesyl-diphosphate farnesyltransferase